MAVDPVRGVRVAAHLHVLPELLLPTARPSQKCAAAAKQIAPNKYGRVRPPNGVEISAEALAARQPTTAEAATPPASSPTGEVSRAASGNPSSDTAAIDRNAASG